MAFEEGDVGLVLRRGAQFLEQDDVFAPGQPDRRMIGRIHEQGAVYDGGQLGRFGRQNVHEEFVVGDRLDKAVQRKLRPGKGPGFAGR